MMNRSKKQAVLAVLMIVLLLVGAVGGTLAYLAAQTGTVENVFEPAGVPSEVEETFDGTTKSNVVIRNNGNVSAYIRAAIVVTWKDAQGNIYPKSPADGEYNLTIGSDWEMVGNYYYYNGTVAAGGTTTNLIVSCAPVAGKAPSGYSLNVEIIGQAIQAEGITGATNAKDAWTKAAQNP